MPSVRGGKTERRDLSSPEILADGSNWQETHLVAPSVCLLKLELSAENLWSTCET